MDLGIRFWVDENENITRLGIIQSTEQIKENVRESVETIGNTMQVRRFITLRIPFGEYTEEEVLAIAKEWYRNFREERLLKVLEGD